MTKYIAIIDYGVGNLRNVQKSLNAIGFNSIITDNARIIENADKLLLPGVGAFSDAILKLQSKNLAELIKKEIKKGKYVLGICLGMQLLLTKSYENGVHDGLNVISGEVIKFNHSLKVPHMGWNNYQIIKDYKIWKGINKQIAFFVHSYYVPHYIDNAAAITNYGNDFASIVIKDNIYGFQFHPEKSGDDGLLLLKNFGGLK